MEKMNLAKALKTKNRIVGEINKLKGLLKRENTRLSTSTSKVDRAELEKNLKDKVEQLISIKTKIATANIGIYEKIERMAECKTLMAYYETLDTRDGSFSDGRIYDGDKQVVYVYNAYLKQEDIDKLSVAYQEQINKLQDEIDEYNARTTIEV